MRVCVMMLVITLSISDLRLFTLQDFLQNFWPELQPAHELYSSISQALQEKESESSQKEYTEHLPAEILEAGIKSGRYIKVQNRSTNLVHALFVFD